VWPDATVLTPLMHGTSTAPASDGDGYRRDNWWGDNDFEVADGEHADYGPPDKDARLAHLILRQCTPKLCGRSVDELADDDEQKQIVLDVAPANLELTEPELHIPKNGSETFGTQDYGQFRHRRRYHPESGYITGGESTWVELALVDHATLMECVEVAISLFDTLPRLDRKARERANELKRNPNGPVDKDIMAQVIAILRQDGDDDEA